jgi:hypothetical protein
LKVFEIEVYTYSFKIYYWYLQFLNKVLSWHRCSRIRWFRAYVFYMSNANIIGKVKMETTAMWGLTLIILKETQLIWMVIRPHVSMYVPLVMIFGIYWFVSTSESYEEIIITVNKYFLYISCTFYVACSHSYFIFVSFFSQYSIFESTGLLEIFIIDTYSS